MHCTSHSSDAVTTHYNKQAALTAAVISAPYSIVLRGYPTQFPMQFASATVNDLALYGVSVCALDSTHSGLCSWLVDDQSSVTVQRAAQCADVCTLVGSIFGGAYMLFKVSSTGSGFALAIVPACAFVVANTCAGNTLFFKKTYQVQN
jgi:hypothetical protein